MEEDTLGGSNSDGGTEATSGNEHGDSPDKSIGDIIGYDKSRKFASNRGRQNRATEAGIAPGSGPNRSIGEGLQPEVEGVGQENRVFERHSEAVATVAQNDDPGRGSPVRDSESVSVPVSSSGDSERGRSDSGGEVVKDPADPDNVFLDILKQRESAPPITKAPPPVTQEAESAFAKLVQARTAQGASEEPKRRGSGRPPKSPAAPAKTQGLGALAGAFTIEEQSIFVMAIRDMADLIDRGLWHVGLDTDRDVPTIEGYPGIPIWELDEKEAEKVKNLFVALGKMRPEVIAAMRAVNQAHAYMQAGLILGERFLETGIQLFKTGINFRLSQADWTRKVKENLQ